VRPGVEPAEPPRNARDADPVGERQVAVAEQRRGAAADRRHTAVLADHRECEPAAEHRGGLPDPVEEEEVGRTAAEGDVLSVVGRGARVALPLGQGLDGAAEGRPRLEQRHLLARVDQVERSREPGEPPAYDDGPHRTSTDPTMRSFVSVGIAVRPSKTSKPAASIRSRIARYSPAKVATQAALLLSR